LLRDGAQPTNSAKLAVPVLQPSGDLIALGHVNALLERFPQLKNFGLTPTAFNAGSLIAFYAEVLPPYYEPAEGAHIRNALSRLRDQGGDAALASAIEWAIAVTELQSNNPDVPRFCGMTRNTKRSGRRISRQ